MHNAAMDAMFSFLKSLVRTLLRLALFGALGLLVLAFLALGLAFALLALVWTLLSGRRPAFFAAWPKRRAPTEVVDVIDVVEVHAHEVRPTGTGPELPARTP